MIPSQVQQWDAHVFQKWPKWNLALGFSSTAIFLTLKEKYVFMVQAHTMFFIWTASNKLQHYCSLIKEPNTVSGPKDCRFAKLSSKEEKEIVISILAKFIRRLSRCKKELIHEIFQGKQFGSAGEK